GAGAQVALTVLELAQDVALGESGGRRVFGTSGAVGQMASGAGAAALAHRLRAISHDVWNRSMILREPVDDLAAGVRVVDGSALFQRELKFAAGDATFAIQLLFTEAGIRVFGGRAGSALHCLRLAGFRHLGDGPRPERLA